LSGSARLVGRANPQQNLHIVIGLNTPNRAAEEKFLEELQTKGSPNYQHFLTADEWNKRFAPSAADEQAAVDWAQSQGLTVVHRFPNRLLVDVEGPVSTVEKALGVSVNTYQLNGKVVFSNDRDPALPMHLGTIVHSISGLNNVQVLHPMNRNAVEPDFSTAAVGAPVAPGPTATARVSTDTR